MDKMILIDLETQDFSVHSGIYEVACLVVEDYEIVDQLYLGNEIQNYKGEKRYGFGFYDISEDEKYINLFKNFLKKYPYPIVAHNCPFDKKFLVHYEWIPEDYPTYCSMRAIRMEDNTLGSYALQNLVNHYKVSAEVQHTAMSDIKNVYEILRIVRPQTWLTVGAKFKNKNYPNHIKARALENIDLDIETTDILHDEVVCFTGKSDYPRNTMQEIAIKNGAEISNNITSKTTMLVVGLDAGSKLDKAQQKDISIISDEEFMNILNLKNKNIGA
ncbi:BRCT domain-containing protein [Clostridium tunisiense]|uniref:BRCT domain-containing protein n=1 Tax=Clostridium tunisiense TaxID=219748 RepID=UPI00031F7272|nr:BRCT domain-containing protein [Clostridium tunisiense]